MSSYLLGGMAALLVARHYASQPATVRGLAWAALPLFLLFIPFGWADEYRVLLEAWPALLLLGWTAFYRLLGIDWEAAVDPAPPSPG